MKFNLFAALTLLAISSNVVQVEAQTVSSSGCKLQEDCAIASSVPNLNLLDEKGREITKSVTTATTVQTEQSDKRSLEGKVFTVADLKSLSQGNAASIRSNLVAQLLPPTDSNGNRIFRSTRGGTSYLGVGANFGLTGGGNIGDRSSFVIVSKLGLTEMIAVRPSILLGRDFATFLLPVTYDFSPQQPFADFRFSPYLGGGIAINTGSTSSYGLLLTGGVDIPLSSVFTLNVAANLAFLNSTDLGIVVGIGYNF